jgi:hypothetical protein
MQRPFCKSHFTTSKTKHPEDSGCFSFTPNTTQIFQFSILAPALIQAVILSLSVCGNAPVGGIVPWSTALVLMVVALCTILQSIKKLRLGIWPPGWWQLTQLACIIVFTAVKSGPGVVPLSFTDTAAVPLQLLLFFTVTV